MSNHITTQEYRTRLRNLKSAVAAHDAGSAIVLPCANAIIKSHDQHFPFFQHRDFLYFTGLDQLEEAALLVFGDRSRESVLLVKQRTAHQKLWDGPGGFSPRMAAPLGLACREVDDLLAATLKELRKVSKLFFDPSRTTLAERLLRSLSSRPLYELQGQELPTSLSHSQLVTAPLRAVKSPAEIQAIREAVSLTESALIEVLKVTRPGCTERQLARLFQGLVHEAGGSLAFEPIVASGPNAAVLHHRATDRKLRSGELVLFDVGAELHGYNGDISRTVSLNAPVAFEKLITRVDQAQEQIARLLRPGKRYADIRVAAQEIMAQAMLDTQLLKGASAKKIVKDGTVKKFFPHGFGHSLGLDVHDPLVGDAVLSPRMVFTVEPGLYSQKKVGKLEPFGIRIEDDFFVSPSGAPKIFSSIPQLLSL